MRKRVTSKETIRNSNKKKSDFLGMPHGTASNRLKKKIMFSLIQRLEEDKCFRCGGKIEVVEDLSVEHKKSWLYVSIELFWDLDNISFSHLKCNKTDRPGLTNKNKIVCPEGQGWCFKCKKFKPLDDFNPSKAHRRNERCKECKKMWLRSKRKKDNKK